MVEPRCDTCRFWWWADDADDERVGECRRRPPTVFVDDFIDPVTRWPRTLKGQWCGEWEVKPNG